MSPASTKGPLDPATIQQYETEYVLHPWMAQKGFKPWVCDRAEGNYFYGADGKKVLDFSSQFVFANLGHADKRVTEAIARQAAILPSINSQFASEPKARLAKLLADVTPGDLCKTFFSTGGAEANEGALKIARWATGKSKVISRYRAYHGSTYGAMSLSADLRNWGSEPGVPSTVHVVPPYCYRCSFGQKYGQCEIECAKHVEEVIRCEGGARRVAALIGEPVMGAGGIIVPPKEYWPLVRQICDKYEMILISDEVMTGFGRLGKWFGMDVYGVLPDIMTFAKGINSGALPLGATVMRKWVADKFEGLPYLHGHTYSGHAVAMASAVATIEAYQEDNLVDNAAKMGVYLGEKLAGLKDKHPSVGDVRGVGLFWGIEIVKNRKTREPLHDPMIEPPRPATAKNRVLGRMFELGVYVLAGQASVIPVAPPLAITKAEIDFGVNAIDEALKEADKDYQD